MLRLFLLLSTFTAFAIAATANAQERTYPTFDDQQLKLILEQEHYEQVKIVESGLLQFTAKGTQYTLYRYEDGDLQLYLGLTGVHLSYLDVNNWNATRRLSRSYLDDDGDPVIEADLLSDGRLSVKNVREFVRVFILSAQQFESFVISKHGG